jgi:hypothetical protein
VRATKEANLEVARQSAINTDTLTGGPLRRLQELAARAWQRAGAGVRATKEANLEVARQSAIKHCHFDGI